MKFLDSLDADIKLNLLSEIRASWTHSSTSIEGNTLSSGETAFVISEGLTISGKPLKDHNEVVGHAKAVDVVCDLVKKDAYSEKDLLPLHRLVIADPVFDVYKPVGDWKKENNSTMILIGKETRFVDFSHFLEVPTLMKKWGQLLNELTTQTRTENEALRAYSILHISLTSIHPFYDGNGRVARLAANIPVLKAGYPPIIIPAERRFDYLRTLAEYFNLHGAPTAKSPLIHRTSLKDFTSFCEDGWSHTLNLVKQAHRHQKNRNTQTAKLLGP